MGVESMLLSNMVVSESVFTCVAENDVSLTDLCTNAALICASMIGSILYNIVTYKSRAKIVV